MEPGCSDGIVGSGLFGGLLFATVVRWQSGTVASTRDFEGGKGSINGILHTKQHEKARRERRDN
jgi:hypothetical protein